MKRTNKSGCRCATLLAAATLTAGTLALSLQTTPSAVISASVGGSPAAGRTEFRNLFQVILANPAQVEGFDIALLNLACAEGLPGAEHMDRDKCLAQLGLWAQHVRTETDRHLYRYRSHPQEYDNSEGYFRMLMMAVVACEDFGVRYNPERISAPASSSETDTFFADSQDLFLHGLCGPTRTGTCSSMPVLYVALGRRLGYPLKLVTTKSHIFARWESSSERFNVEATGRGMNRYDDEHFKHSPFPVTDEEMRVHGYLKSLSPKEELALFLSLRGHCLTQAGRVQEAAVAYDKAVSLAPAFPGYKWLLTQARQRSSAVPQEVLSPQPYALSALLGPRTENQLGINSDPNPLQKIR